MRPVLCGLLFLVALTLCGCGKSDPEPVERTNPLPRERFPGPGK